MTSLPKTQIIETELEKGWLTIWFNQPERRNPMTDEMMTELVAVLEAVRQDRSVRGITLRGRGGIFCAGGDLKNFAQNFQTGREEAAIKAMSRSAAKIFDQLNTAPQVTIALVEGAAMAGGFGLSCCADIVLVEEGAKFAMTEIRIGLSPAQIAPFIIQRLGYRNARRLMLSAARFTGIEAAQLGYADFIAADVAGLEAIETQLRKQVLGCAAGAIADTKALILALPGLDRKAQIELAADNFTRRMLNEESKEGIASFFEKRKPVWAEE